MNFALKLISFLVLQAIAVMVFAQTSYDAFESKASSSRDKAELIDKKLENEVENPIEKIKKYYLAGGKSTSNSIINSISELSILQRRLTSIEKEFISLPLGSQRYLVDNRIRSARAEIEKLSKILVSAKEDSDKIAQNSSKDGLKELIPHSDKRSFSARCGNGDFILIHFQSRRYCGGDGDRFMCDDNVHLVAKNACK